MENFTAQHSISRQIVRMMTNNSNKIYERIQQQKIHQNNQLNVPCMIYLSCYTLLCLAYRLQCVCVWPPPLYSEVVWNGDFMVFHRVFFCGGSGKGNTWIHLVMPKTVTVLEREEGYKVKYNTWPEGVPEDKAQGNSWRQRVIFDGISWVESDIISF